MAKERPVQEMLPLTQPVFHILLALADEERHGYGIMQDVAKQTEGALQLGQVCHHFPREVDGDERADMFRRIRHQSGSDSLLGREATDTFTWQTLS